MKSKQHLEETRLLMGTVVSVHAVDTCTETALREATARAFDAMGLVEAICSRFDETSALRELCRHPGEWMQVPDVLFEALRVAVEVSDLTQGAFDPTVGATLMRRGFTRHYLTHEDVPAPPVDASATYRDILLNESTRQVCLQKPMLLDLGAVAKGLAVDLAVGVLHDFAGFAVNAGGDLYVQGTDPTGEHWTIGIQHPEQPDERIAWLQGTDLAVCTSGSYERRSPLDPTMDHIVRSYDATNDRHLVSCTVVAPFTVMADAVSTAAFVLGPSRALGLIEEVELAGLCVDDQLSLSMTESMRRYLL